MQRNHPTLKESTTGTLGPVPCPVRRQQLVDVWKYPLVMGVTGFHFKSLCNFTVNPCMGCGHGCPFCYVPEVSASKQKAGLAEHGVTDANGQWGEYVLLRRWDEEAFRKSLQECTKTPASKLQPGGHRAVMMSSTTDPYQHLRHPDTARARELNACRAAMVRRALEIIRDESDLKVRVQTRFTAAEADLELLASFGPRLLLGTSVITLDPGIGKLYEPHVPDSARRLAMLAKARSAGVNVYVALAPVPPEVDEGGLRETLTAIAAVEPCTVFCESLNVRGGNIDRIQKRAAELGVQTQLDLFGDPGKAAAYSLRTLQSVERIAAEVGLANQLHLWPDKGTLGGRAAFAVVDDPARHTAWLFKWWNRISEWPETLPARVITSVESEVHHDRR